MKKNGAFTAYAWEPADDRAVADIRVIIKTFSFSKARQQRELVEFIRRSEEIERCVQRYQYLAERNHAITQDSAHAVDERQKRFFTRASRELKTLPWEVHELVQSLEEYRNDKYCKKLWIRDYLSTGRRAKSVHDVLGAARLPVAAAIGRGEIDPAWMARRVACRSCVWQVKNTTKLIARLVACCIRRRGFRACQVDVGKEL